MYLIMNNLNFSQIRPISSLPRSYSELAEGVQGGEDMVFLKRNTPYVVLLDFERWQKLVDMERKQEELQALADVRKSESEFEAGKAKKLKSLADLR